MESLLYVGAVSEHKGLVPLIEAFAQLKDSYPSLRLEIVGWSRYDAPFRNRLLDMVAELKLENRILFLGHQDNPSFFFGRALIHVAPSIWEEPFANVVLEAKREGVPSVVFPSGGLPEMVRHKIDGFVCRDKSVEALVEGLSWMLSDADRLIRMRSAAKGDSIARFGRQRFAREWASVYLFNCLTVN